MKKVWKKNEVAVSPVIATILMVAITVVLAAVLYVMVMGMTDPTVKGPTGVLGDPNVSVNATAGYDVVISITSLTPDTVITNLDYKVGTGTTADVSTIANYSASSCVFTDVGGEGSVSSGDYFTIRGQSLTAAGVTFYLVFEPTGAVINAVLITP
jgi:archaeal type IV pilus assembly protein PilA